MTFSDMLDKKIVADAVGTSGGSEEKDEADAKTLETKREMSKILPLLSMLAQLNAPPDDAPVQTEARYPSLVEQLTTSTIGQTMAAIQVQNASQMPTAATQSLTPGRVGAGPDARPLSSQQQQQPERTRLQQQQ